VLAAKPEPWTLAEAHLLAGEYSLARSDLLPARASFELALATAREGKHTRLSQLAARGLVTVEGVGLLLKVDEPLRIVSDLAPKGALQQARVAVLRAELALAQGKPEDAKDGLVELLADEKSLEGDLVHTAALVALTEAHLMLDEPSRAETRAKQAMLAAKKREGDPRNTARAAIAMARVEVALGKPADAADRLIVLRKAFVDFVSIQDPLLARIDDELGLAREAEGKLAEARKAYERSRSTLTMIRKDHPLAAYPWARLAWLSVREGHDGRKEATEALTLAEVAFGKDSPTLVTPLRALAAARAQQKDLTGALEALDKATELVEGQFGFVAPLYGDVTEDRGLVYTAFGRFKDALTAHDDGILCLQSRYGGKSRKVIANLVRRADLATKLGDDEYAQRLYGVALPDLEEHLGPTDPEVVALRKKIKKP